MSLLKPLSAISHLTLKCLTGIVSKLKIIYWGEKDLYTINTFLDSKKYSLDRF